jgi:hypothetical protein
MLLLIVGTTFNNVYFFSNTWSRGEHISIPLLGRIFLQEALMHQSFLKIR